MLSNEMAEIFLCGLEGFLGLGGLFSLTGIVRHVPCLFVAHILDQYRLFLGTSLSRAAFLLVES